ncbi:MAG TPA: hypothetical protein VF953_11775 [Terriglobales bacterium]
MSLLKKIAYASKVLPRAAWRALGASPRGPLHLVIAMADHFEPAIDPESGQKRVSRSEQERRLESWSREYPEAVDRWRDHDGRPFVHTYFYPAEQYDEGLLQMLADHCHAGWGEVEIHLHHGMAQPDTAENTRHVLTEFRDQLAFRHRCLAMEQGSDRPRYAFVHGNFALANSASGRFCGVDSEMKVLAETGCYADFTLPTGPHHPAQTTKINSLYECALPLEQAAPHRQGNNLAAGRTPQTFPVIVQGPLLGDWKGGLRSPGMLLETSAITRRNPMSLHRLALWKQARITVQGRPDWLFIKLHCHGMDPTQKDVVMGQAFRMFLEELVGSAAERKETLHFVTAREMTNIIFAACDARDGNPGEYRDYRFKPIATLPVAGDKWSAPPVSVKG